VLRFQEALLVLSLAQFTLEFDFGPTDGVRA
jgi:hypothetical protein